MIKPANLPARPGIYQFLSNDGQTLYVGKAVNLKNRVGSYFSDTHADRPWIRTMIDLINRVEVIVVSNEIEALMLEATLIRQHQPRFNIKLTDDKSYPYLKLTVNEPIPRLAIVRRIEVDQSRYFGPYLTTRVARAITETLADVYGLHYSTVRLTTTKRPCFACQLAGRPCVLAGQVDYRTYQNTVARAIEFLLGKKKRLLIDLNRSMNTAASKQNFELAGRLRDRVASIKQSQVEQAVRTTHPHSFDVIGLARSPQLSSVSILRVENGQLTGQYRHTLAGPGEEIDSDDHPQIISSFLLNYYPSLYQPPRTVVVGQFGWEPSTLSKVISQAAGRKVGVVSPSRGKKKRLLELAETNAAWQLQAALARAGLASAGLARLKDALRLDFWPKRIEAVDVSNLGSSEIVGATSCLIDALPVKDQYRRFRIRAVTGQNDYAALAEIISRRLADFTRPTPDLLVIDGGRGQLSAGMAAVNSAEQAPRFVLALAKKPDRLYLAGVQKPLVWPKTDPGLRLLALARDEVHRFALGFQRSRQRKKLLPPPPEIK